MATTIEQSIRHFRSEFLDAGGTPTRLDGLHAIWRPGLPGTLSGTGYVTTLGRYDLTKSVMAVIAARFGGHVRVSGPTNYGGRREWEVEYDAATDNYEVWADGDPVIVTRRQLDTGNEDILANR